MGSMKTEDYLILGVAGFLAYKMLQKDVGQAIEDANPLNSFPSIDFSNLFGSNFFGGFNFPAITYPAFNFNLAQPDPYTGAQPDPLTGLPKGAQKKNEWGPGALGYAYDFKTEIIPPTGYIPTPSLLGPIRSAQTIALAQAGDWKTLNLQMMKKEPIMSQGPIMSRAPIMSPYVPLANKPSDMGTTGNTGYSRTVAQQAYIDARSHLGSPIGTPGATSQGYEPNAIIASSGGNYVVTDSSGNVVHDTSLIINQSARQADINRLTGR